MSVFIRHKAEYCSFNSDNSWVVLSPIEQSIKAKIEALGTPLKDWDINIYRGVLTGYNDAFIINGDKKKKFYKIAKPKLSVIKLPKLFDLLNSSLSISLELFNIVLIFFLNSSICERLGFTFKNDLKCFTWGDCKHKYLLLRCLCNIYYFQIHKDKMFLNNTLFYNL